MKLSKLLKPLTLQEDKAVIANFEMEITDIIFDSRSTIKDCAFVCMRGSAADGHKYAKSAEEKGAAVIIAEEPVEVDIPVFLVKDTRKALALMSATFFGNPADKDITVIGITGTKGKTTTATMIRSILEASGAKTGIMGTIGVGIGDKVIKTENTTPSSYEIQKYLRQMADSDCRYCVMEVSSIGLKDLRVYGFEFAIGLFTNFSEDHIGGVEHKDMQEYLESKSMLFKMCRLGIINIDDESWQNMIKGHTCAIKTYGFHEEAQMRAESYQLLSRPGFLGISFAVSGELNFIAEVAIPGKFNAYNALAAIACCHELGISSEMMNKGLGQVSVKGRVEPVEVPGHYTLLIDYAHNAVSMQNILETLREYHPNRLICLFGAGGNRPKLRRYEMGEVCGNMADLSVITADNSRFEDVNDIIEDIKTGMHKTNGKYVTIPDRKEAIRYCLEKAQEGDIIVLAGKGHEDYQEINGQKFHFDEREVVADILKELENR
ncbi:UDP-N-acetylmuramoyl-L-alanyl-D-glutamate--2,6-diaminopimelate ligase [Scatolibacter rhodanostii]|uniref:UDP-N-acetylmuramoyl-L-alanyl-D-glutamate--2, 6-diaminopimelate ligase n=1 Tax=Scatolibacter rhodanostii TaxID=2014781 RepID=UPI000C06B4CF|nr:UDP-N-acetylmuramoyl-L-alanyl-D-glutamate--2,6-diaminopimelate ligase [Scatolibacter rhodanostii]